MYVKSRVSTETWECDFLGIDVHGWKPVEELGFYQITYKVTISVLCAIEVVKRMYVCLNTVIGGIEQCNEILLLQRAMKSGVHRLKPKQRCLKLAVNCRTRLVNCWVNIC